MSTFTPEQEYRHQMYKRSTLNKTQLKRIVNQTVSQSVTALPLIAIGAYSKFFVGEIVTRALDVQKEWAAAFDENIRRQRQREREREERDRDRERKQNDRGDDSNADKTKAADAQVDVPKGGGAKAKKVEFVPNPHKGGLLPDHLREALRRYKGDGEGGGVGFASTSLGMMGNHGAGTWRVGNGVGARRLFR
jgi:transcription initiation factor TFIID subunit 11